MYAARSRNEVALPADVVSRGYGCSYGDGVHPRRSHEFRSLRFRLLAPRGGALHFAYKNLHFTRKVENNFVENSAVLLDEYEA
ncbi:Hypothetical protein NTJ_09679 [Nesidiocoris tenuis]|uniref:Uncharacterized protein n=1 Tax=Nesidiocoris tenuis TaxID=355587 RepID=A0ABN7AXE5_9HEMI|nr:Hypothetical protein NTJ_09679 [Nesidiocoris tenuis]